MNDNFFKAFFFLFQKPNKTTRAVGFRYLNLITTLSIG